MKIGFDAKRAFFNNSGLGNYSRNVIRYLSQYYPENEYILYIPRQRKSNDFKLGSHVSAAYPESWAGKRVPSLWRSSWLGLRLDKDRIDLYHGLSNEIPFNSHKYNFSSVVTIHDLIFMRFPGWYKKIDRKIYIQKAVYSARAADRIIAISRQTKNDIVEYLGTDPGKIDVVYQGCDPAFYSEIDAGSKNEILSKYGLSKDYILIVGTIEERKNLLSLVKAMEILSDPPPLVVIGRPTAYAKKVKNYIYNQKIPHITFLEKVPNADLPALYQSGLTFVYPSLFEGFGIPILEALNSRIPVITTRKGCFSEAGGTGSLYVDPGSPEEIAEALNKVISDSSLREKMISSGQEHARNFTQDKISSEIMKVYQKVLEG